jgi:glucokinase
MARYLVLDIGGTFIKYAIMDEEANFILQDKVPAQTSSEEEMLQSLRELKSEVGDDYEGVAISMPGRIDTKAGIAHTGGAFTWLNEYPAAERYGAIFGKPTTIANDGKCAASAESWEGALKDVNSGAVLVLGTGVGGGVVANGKLISGAFGAGGEIGHVTVNRDETETCGCGRKGCLEQYSSASGIVRSYQKECARLGSEPVALDGPTDTLTVFDEYRAGSKPAQVAIATMCDCLGYALAQISVIIDPQMYLIGGGVGGGFNWFAEDLRAAFRKYCLAPSVATRILPASLGNEAAIFGSAYMALQS